MTVPRIVYLCPNRQVPTGGVKVIYRHAERLASQGVDAMVYHPDEPDFRCDWFAHGTRFLGAGRDGQSALSRDDFVVVPEVWAGGHGDRLRQAGQRYAIFVQNGYFTHPFLPGESADMLGAVYGEAERIIAISADTAVMTRLNHPAIDEARVALVSCAVGPAFHGPAAPSVLRRIITYMPRKMTDHVGRVVFALQRNLPETWRFQPIDGVSEMECAGLMRGSDIFLSFAEFEGLSLPPAEAAIAGNVVIGYTGQGGAFYWRGPRFIEIQQGDIVGFVDAVLATVARLERAQAHAEAPAAELKEIFSPDAEDRALAALVRSIRR